MTKILSFSALEVLPSLLNHKKVQTIRPLWERYGVESAFPTSDTAGDNTPARQIKPRFKVGDKVRLYWKQRSSIDLWQFCPNCKVTTPMFQLSPEPSPYDAIHKWHKECNKQDCIVFPKILGEAEITEVSDMWMGPDYTIKIDEYKELARKDGFASWEEMQRWFEQRYFFKSPSNKKFAVYRWKWF